MVPIFCLRSCGEVEFRAKRGPVRDLYLRLDISTYFSIKKYYRAVGWAGKNIKKKVSHTKKSENKEIVLKQLSDPSERIVVEMAGGSDPVGK